MPGTLHHSPADIIRRLIIALGQGSNPDVSPLGDWPVYKGTEPDRPDRCITVFNTTGVGEGRTQPDGEVQIHYGFQVRLRGTDPNDDSTYVKANSVALALDGVYRRLLLIGSTYYRIHAITNRKDPIDIGRNVPNTKRLLVTVNATVSIREEPQLSAPLAFWPLAGDLNDYSGNGRHLSVITVPTSSLTVGPGGVGGTGRRFITIGGAKNPVGFLTSPSFAISLWFRLSTLNSPGIPLFLFSQNAGGDGPEFRKQSISVNGDSSTLEGANGFVTSNNPIPLSQGAWHHAVLVQVGGQLLLYQDGSLVGVADAPDGPEYTGIDRVGVLLGDVVNPGDYIEVAMAGVWGTSLSAVEVQTLYNSGRGFNPYA